MKLPKRVLVTGFEPFDGRQVNASWIAAQACAASHDSEHVRSLLLPVQWDAPRTALESLFRVWQPHIIIALGEGRPGGFRLETLARNQRSHRQDNNANYPPNPLISSAGPSHFDSTCNAQRIVEALLTHGFRAEQSTDAGGFLCEELLYTLELLKLENAFIQQVSFIHIPPFGSHLCQRQTRRQCDEILLQEFSQALLHCAH